MASASHSQTPTPTSAVDPATCGVSGGCGASSGGSVELRGDATEPLLSYMCELAKLVVGMARQPPARINSYLYQRLDSASTVQEVLAAAVAPHRLPPQETDELVRLRDEVSRLQTRCEGAERGLANELDIAVAEQAYGVQWLKDRCRSSDADCAAAIRYVAEERERMKAGLTVYNAELAKLRQYLEEHDRGKVCSPTPRMKALLAENASLRRANSVLRQALPSTGSTMTRSSSRPPDFRLLDSAGSSWVWVLITQGSYGLCRQSEGSVSENSVPPATEVSGSSSKASLGSGSPNEGSAEHSFIRPLSDLAVERSAKDSVSDSDSGELLDDEPTKYPPRKRKRLPQNAVVRPREACFVQTPCCMTARSAICRLEKENGVPLPFLRSLARATRRIGQHSHFDG
ncbi:LOW QUALITY PROTEIN: hypothetical protein PHMEG_00013306 [Phytophthora megakarya]|uniref:Uncharacterized protein n=1 Tax=Phytophthora megakarya TaxID=4795 RepID=A0A225W894_9STRA|nr:LOW QUALITY PROTEIN: hypothetical protein PHMEG_00013306 [Phytophthora megakarya]